ncbi:condensation domain-containing protein [Streptomyces sp. 8N114]|uniref:condensation domain-containing protein n=1 Tax=Streptomyces sp. 8N114 TaxID=3457419 RepID=UPI003FD652A2
MVDGAGQNLSDAGRELLRKRLAARPAATPDSLPEPADEAVPLAPAQHRLWFIDRLTKGSLAYNVSAAYRLQGPLDVPALERALTYVLDRHEVLRTEVTVTEEGEPRLRTAFRAEDIRPTVHEVTEAQDPAAEAHRLAEQYSDTSFDLERGPLLRLWLAKLAEEDHVLGLAVHHILFDRDSLDILSREVSAAYRAFTTGAEPGLAPPAAQYADFAREQARTARSADLDRRAEVWRERLRGVPPVLELPADHERPGQPSYRAGQALVRVPSGVCGKLRALSSERGTTPFVVFLAAFHGLLGRLAAQEAVVVGCPFNGRSQVAQEGLIGFFVNSLPIPGDLRDDPPFTDLVDRVREQVLAAYDDQHVPFDRIVKAVDPPRDMSRNPLVQVWFDLADGGPGGTAPPLALPGVTVSYFTEGRARTRFDAELHLGTAPDGAVTGRLLYARDLFEQKTAESFCGYYTHFLQAVAAQPGTRVSQVPILSPDQLSGLLESWAVAGE